MCARCAVQVVLRLQPAWMVWKGELACLLGLLALLLLAVVGLASLPSVSASLNWAEWRLVQSRVGLAALALALAHVAAMGAPGWAKGGPGKTLRSITFLSALLPALTLLLRAALALPPASRRLKKIRRGWERAASSSDAAVEAASQRREGCCSSRKSNLKRTGTAPGGGGGIMKASQNPVYTAISLSLDNKELEEGCASCQNGSAHGSLPTRNCVCSMV